MDKFKNSSTRGKIIRISILLAGFILPFFFVVHVLPFMSEALGVAHMHQIIIDEEIDAGAWFWAFVEQYSEIIPSIRNQMRFTPGGRPGTAPDEGASLIEQIQNYY